MLPKILFIILFTIHSSFNVGLAGDTRRDFAGDSPFTAKASLIRYWKTHISGNKNSTPSSFFLSKASPLTAVQLVKYSNLAGNRSLSAHLAAFCKAAELLCSPEVGHSLITHIQDADFATYKFDNFTNYGTNYSFHTYSNEVVSSEPEDPIATNSFRRYSRGATANDDEFTAYANGSTYPNQVFNSYGAKSTAGAGEFSNYFNNTVALNFPVEFTSYSDSANGRRQDFKEYANHAVIGGQNFTSYGKNAGKSTNAFARYGDDSAGIDTTFNSYAQNGVISTENFTSYAANNRITENQFKSYAAGAENATETFTSYTPGGGIPASEFRSYGSGGNSVHQEFVNYSENSISPHHLFKSYGEDSKSEILGFVNYASSSDVDNFVGYDKNNTGQKSSFKTYKPGNNFKGYAKTGSTFSTYMNQTAAMAAAVVSNKVFVEPGKFFREQMLKTGTVMPIPDIRDKMPKRPFLPRAIYSKLPFSSGEIEEMKEIFHAGEGSSLVGMLENAVRECERAPSAGETKRCAGSGEDMIDFATSVLGKNVVVRTTENTRGSGGNILIGNVIGINGGRLTKSVSCHQSLYPSLLYYCHSVPKVRVYEADILDPNSNEKINHGVAICHIDTSTWSSGHGAFISLGSGPGKIEVCHWIFENDMIWTVSD